METDDSLILVVDDDPVTRIRVSGSLEDAGYTNVREAADGHEARDFLAKHDDVDLVITDIMMPGIDGIDLLRWGRQHVPGAIWILLSGLDTFDVAVEAIRLGAFDFLGKPPGVDEMQVAVRNALERSRLLRERDRLYDELEDTNRHLLDKVRELEDKSELLRRDLQRAEVIQRALLPTEPPPIDRFCIHTIYRPGQFVGGDLYDVIPLDDRHVGLYVADATGHGVTSAMLSVLYKQRLVLTEAETRKPLSPATVLHDVNQALLSSVEAPGLFLTVAYCLLDTRAADITIASAGHPPLVHVRASGDVELIRKTGPALGLTKDAEFGETKIHLETNDRMFLFTDGLLDADPSHSIDALRPLLGRRDLSAEEVIEELVPANREGRPVEERDDITLLILDVHAGPSHFDNGELVSIRAARRPVMPSTDVLFYGEDDDVHFLGIRGRATWIHCDALFETSRRLLDTDRPVVLDLSECEYLDSTCLGTIHEIVSWDDLTLQNVQPAVRQLFEELTMKHVLENIGPGRPVPDMHPLATPPSTDTSGPLRILRAHEALAALSVRNREKFQEVVEALRKELSDSD